MNRLAKKCADGESVNSAIRLIGESVTLDTLREQISVAAKYDEPVLILGESGTGKELVARSIHDLSRRRHRPLHTVNCGAIPDDILTAELFGHKAGAFTGASRSRVGRVRAADRSTLFLDEVSETSSRFQVALLRVVDQGEVQPLGEDCTQAGVDVRFISATNRARAELQTGEFLRRDLFYRLSSFLIVVPPLRERKEDIPSLVMHFTWELTQKYGTSWRFSGSAIRLLYHCSFPGNIRELRQIVFAACVGSSREVVSAEHLRSVLEGIQWEMNPNHSNGHRDLALRSLLRQHLEEVILVAECNLSRAARLLEVPRSTLQHLLVRHGLDFETIRARAQLGSPDAIHR